MKCVGILEEFGMDDWQHRILGGLRSARLLATFLSPSYFASRTCHWEFDEYLKHEAARPFLGEGIAPIYLVEVPGWIARPANEHIDEKWQPSYAGVTISIFVHGLIEAPVHRRMPIL